MKALKLAIAVLFFSAIFTACKKESVSNPTSSGSSITGTWKGMYGYGSNNDEFFYSFKINNDGTVQELNSSGVVTGEGTWKLEGTAFTATHHYVPSGTKTFISTATFDATSKKLVNGIWKYSHKTTDEGKWFMQKN